MTAAADHWVLLLSEAEFQEMVVARARIRGWLVHHDRGDYRQTIAGDAGFPDLVLAKDGAVIFAEIKAERGKVSQVQHRWLSAIYPDGVQHIWRPSDWLLIQSILDGQETSDAS